MKVAFVSVGVFGRSASSQLAHAAVAQTHRAVAIIALIRIRIDRAILEKFPDQLPMRIFAEPRGIWITALLAIEASYAVFTDHFYNVESSGTAAKYCDRLVHC
jgi:hypothetical protein